jgi:single-stranded-DNA-specific exonuclease
MPFDPHPTITTASSTAVLNEALRLLSGVEQPFTVDKELSRAELAAVPEYTPLQVQVLHNRGIEGHAAVAVFMGRGWKTAGPPLPDEQKAVERIRTAIEGRERITVFGDYDADGMTSCAILTLALRTLGADVEPYIPLRDDDGRGLNGEAIHELANRGTRLLVTTDCGTGNVDEIRQAHDLGMEVIVTDHHPPQGPLPAAYAVVNPACAAAKDGRSDLSGAGVAFRLAEALLAPTELGARLEELLDLVAVGTIGDVVPLSVENWGLARAGLRRLNTTPSPGLRALLSVARLAPGEVTERDISFSIAPRLNAAARLDEPMTAVNLLTAKGAEEARALASQLDALNIRRQAKLEEMMVSAREQARTQMGGVDAPAVLIVEGTSHDWPLGMIGLVASKLAEEYGRPAFAISVGARECRGSARGPEGSRLGDVLKAREGLFKRFGGHPRAAGFTLSTERLEELKGYLRSVSGLDGGADANLEGADAIVRVDCELTLARLDKSRYDAVRVMAPFGPGFKEPVFVCRNVRIEHCWRSGLEGRTLRLRLRDGTGERVVLWSRRGEWCAVLQQALHDLPMFDVVLTLGADGPRGGGKLDVTARVLFLQPAGR